MPKEKQILRFCLKEKASVCKDQIKQRICRYCGRYGTTISYGNYKGYYISDTDKATRGMRFCCNKRRTRKRKGCGRIFVVLFEPFLLDRQVTALQLEDLVKNMQESLKNDETKSAAFSRSIFPFTYSHFLHVWKELKENSGRLRDFLSRICKPSESTQSIPFLQTLEHLKQCFPKSNCLILAFQRHFQEPFLS